MLFDLMSQLQIEFSIV